MLDVAVEIDRRDLTVSAEFTVDAGERLALFGPSGAGKTSILEVIAGLMPPTRGNVTLAGRDLTRVGHGRRVAVAPWMRRVALLRQNPGLFPHMSVRENLRYSRSAADRSESVIVGVASRLEIVDLLDAHPRSLSGGQAHRVALARMLLGDHDALLFDEPYTGLDARLRRVLTGVLRDESRSRQIPSVLVAHELAEAQAFADRLAVIDAGRIVQVAAPLEVVRWPASRRVAELVGYLGFVPSELAAPSGLGLPAGSTIGVHPERVRRGALPSEGVVLSGTVSDVEPLGAGWDVELSVPDREPQCSLRFRVDDDPPPEGSRYSVTVLDPPCFDEQGGLRKDQRTASTSHRP